MKKTIKNESRSKKRSESILRTSIEISRERNKSEISKRKLPGRARKKPKKIKKKKSRGLMSLK